MAYRFLLEVPRSLAAEAGVAVAEAGDAQVILVRDSHGLGFDEPYADMTIAAHSLRIIDTLYNWFDNLGASRPDLRLVLHGGDRLALEAYERGAMVAAVRRDQPWVERTIPKIGEHEPDPSAAAFSGAATERAGVSAPGAGAEIDAAWAAPTSVAVAEPEPRSVLIRRLNHVALRVMDLAKAERFYAEFFAMELTTRARRDARGALQTLDGDYRWDEATRTGTEADVSFMRNGPLTLALHRAGRGARLDLSSLFAHISIAVSATTFAALKGEILMRSFEVLASAETAVVFRDPFGVTWEVAVQGSAGADQ
jgi:catechol 2,3-dioxygenase-like lactoylglutathione lyase family enzyme